MRGEGTGSFFTLLALISGYILGCFVSCGGGGDDGFPFLASGACTSILNFSRLVNMISDLLTFSLPVFRNIHDRIGNYKGLPAHCVTLSETSSSTARASVI